MAEETTGLESGQEGSGGSVDPAAIALALGSASRSEADAFLRRQGALIDDQRHHLRAQLLPALSEKWLGVFLRLATACVGIGVAFGIGFLVWQAAHSDGLRVESFSVPPAFAERGLTGEVVASRVIDRLSELQTQTNTARPARSYSNAWGDKAIKLEIPEAGISLEELDSWLRARIGHETSLSGEVVRSETGVTLTARTSDGAVSVSGPEADIDALTGKLAEAIYRLTQPYRYAIYIYRHENRPADAVPIFKQLALNGTPDDKYWSYNMWAAASEDAAADSELGLAMFRQANKADPNAVVVYTPLVARLRAFGLTEEALQAAREWMERSARSAGDTEDGRKFRQAYRDLLVGAYHDALPAHADYARNGRPGQSPAALKGFLITDQIGEHDLAGARASQADLAPGQNADRWRLTTALAAEDWRAALGFGDLMASALKTDPHDRRLTITQIAPPLALAQAHLGDFAAAEKVIAPTRGDCDPCLIARAQIAELAGQRGRAEYWFARADATAPSLPFAFEAEGRALLDRNQPDAAIARFTIANRNTPHFADPLEGWGEALMAKNQSHLALAKFAEAEKYAPNWGRLHLKWGEALAYAGKKDEAAKQFARATQLDLTSSEKAELVRTH